MNNASFRCAWWLRSAHLQTVWGRFIDRRPKVAMRREALPTPDGDEVILDHLETPGAPVRVLLMHGLEGNSNSGYIQRLLAAMAARGWSATVMNSRSCAADPADPTRMLPNLRPRLYHSGETSDFDLVARTMAGREPRMVRLAAGVSLGGNALLKWLGENPGQDLVRAAATVSVPYDLAAGGAHLERGLGRYYVRFFLRTLKPKALDILARFPEMRERLDASAILRADSFSAFDQAATAPLHGFRGARDYYERCSSIAFAGRITVPVLCLSSADDPFTPREVLDRFRAAASPLVELVVTRHGGHVGFVAGAFPWSFRFWSESFVVEWLAGQVSGEVLGVRCQV